MGEHEETRQGRKPVRRIGMPPGSSPRPEDAAGDSARDAPRPHGVRTGAARGPIAGPPGAGRFGEAEAGRRPAVARPVAPDASAAARPNTGVVDPDAVTPVSAAPVSAVPVFAVPVSAALVPVDPAAVTPVAPVAPVSAETAEPDDAVEMDLGAGSAGHGKPTTMDAGAASGLVAPARGRPGLSDETAERPCAVAETSAAPGAPATRPGAARADDDLAVTRLSEATLVRAGAAGGLGPDGEPAAVLVFPGGEEHVLRGGVVIGRDPVVSDGACGLAVPASASSVSKTHAVLAWRGQRLMVMDAHSTNGTAIVGGDGAVVQLRAGVESEVAGGSVILLGEFSVRVFRG